MAGVREMRNTHVTLLEIPEQKGPLERRTEGDNIKIDLKEVMCEDVSWIHMSQDKDQ
jgi:hypothetical protein